MEKIAYKSTFMIGIRIGVIILCAIFVVIPNEENIFTYLQLIMVAYGVYNLIMLTLQVIQPKVLITHDEDNLTIWRINKSVIISRNDIVRIEARQSSTRGVTHKFGSLSIFLQDESIIKVSNVDKVLETKENIDQLINLHN